MVLIENIMWGVAAAAGVACVAIAAHLVMPAYDRIVAWRDRRRQEHGDTGEHEIIPEPHEGATQAGTGIVEAEEDLLGVWTVPLWEARPSIFDELANRTPVRLDWEPESFTGSWRRGDIDKMLERVSA